MLMFLLTMGCGAGSADWAMLLECKPLDVEGGGSLTLCQGEGAWYTPPGDGAAQEPIAAPVWIDVVGPSYGLLTAVAWVEEDRQFQYCVEEIVPAGDGFELSICGEVFQVFRADEVRQ